MARRRRAYLGRPAASDVKITRPDGTVEIEKAKPPSEGELMRPDGQFAFGTHSKAYTRKKSRGRAADKK